MDLLAEYASDGESSSSTSDGNERETVNADKDSNAGAVRLVYLVTYCESGGCGTTSYKKIVCRGRCWLFYSVYTEILH